MMETHNLCACFERHTTGLFAYFNNFLDHLFHSFMDLILLKLKKFHMKLNMG